MAATVPIVGKRARESFRVFEAYRPGGFAQASNEQEEPSHERFSLKCLLISVHLPRSLPFVQRVRVRKTVRKIMNLKEKKTAYFLTRGIMARNALVWHKCEVATGSEIVRLL